MVLLPDRDGPGVKAGGELASRLRGEGRRVRLVECPRRAPGNRIDPADPAATVEWMHAWRTMARGGGPEGTARAWRWLLSGCDEPEGAAA